MKTSCSFIELTDWSVRFGQRTVLKDIDLRLSGPGIVVLMGPAGTGKSTLLKTLAGVSRAGAHYGGQLLLDGHSIEKSPLLPALVQQHPRDLGLSVLDVLMDALRAGQRALTPTELRESARQTLEALGQHDLLQSLNSRLFNLPRDQMWRALIVRAALSNSSVLLIDEPTSSLDDTQAATVLELIQRLARDRCCVLTLHHQAQARSIAGRVILLAGGRIQVDAEASAFFANTSEHPVLAQFLRTGSCSVPGPDALPEELDSTCSVDGTHFTVPTPTTSIGALTSTPTADRPAQTHPVASVVGSDSDTASTAIFPAGILPASRGPNGFHWLIPGKLAGCPMPGAMLPLEHDLTLLRAIGVTVLINLTEKPMVDTAIPFHGLRTLHMGVEDRNAPPLMWMKMLLVQIDRLLQQNEVVAVHCLAGLGRTGTVLGAWLVREGLTAEEALRRLRAIEPGFVQSKVQEDLLHELETNLLIRLNDL